MANYNCNCHSRAISIFFFLSISLSLSLFDKFKQTKTPKTIVCIVPQNDTIPCNFATFCNAFAKISNDFTNCCWFFECRLQWWCLCLFVCLFVKERAQVGFLCIENSSNLVPFVPSSIAIFYGQQDSSLDPLFGCFAKTHKFSAVYNRCAVLPTIQFYHLFFRILFA